MLMMKRRNKKHNVRVVSPKSLETPASSPTLFKTCTRNTLVVGFVCDLAYIRAAVIAPVPVESEYSRYLGNQQPQNKNNALSKGQTWYK